MTQKEKLIESLSNAELFLRNRANALPAPLNEYDVALMTDASKAINESIEMLENSIMLPCKVGDTVYFIIEDIDETYISSEKITDVSTRGVFCSSIVGMDRNDDFIPYSDIGVDAFFDEEAAKNALVAKQRKEYEK